MVEGRLAQQMARSLCSNPVPAGGGAHAHKKKREVSVRVCTVGDMVCTWMHGPGVHVELCRSKDPK